MRRLSFYFAALLASVPLLAQQRPVITSGQSSYDGTTDTLTVTGNATLTFGTAILHADRMTWHQKSNVVTAEGHVELTDGPRRLIADKLTYEVSTGAFTAERVRLGEYPLYVGGKLATGTKASVTVSDAMVVLREPNIFSPTVRASKITYSSGQVVEAESAKVGVGSALPISLPKFTQKLNEPALSYVTLDAGYRGSLGAFGTAGLHVPVSDTLLLGGDLGIYTARGIMFGPSGSYRSPTDPEALHGTFSSGYINDHGTGRTTFSAARSTPIAALSSGPTSSGSATTSPSPPS